MTNCRKDAALHPEEWEEAFDLLEIALEELAEEEAKKKAAVKQLIALSPEDLQAYLEEGRGDSE